MNRVELKRLSKRQLKGNFKVPVLLTLIYVVLMIITTMFQESSNSSITAVIAFLLSAGFQSFMLVSFPNFFLQFSKDPELTNLSDALVDTKIFTKAIGFTILMTIIGLIVGLILGIFISIATFSAIVSSSDMIYYTYSNFSFILIIVGITALFMIPLIVLELALALTGYILVDKNDVGVFEAIGLSVKMMKGNKWKLFVINISFIGWGILCLFTLGIGFLWLLPYINLTTANFYKDLKGEPVY